MGGRISLTVAVDASVLGSGRGGDETQLRSMLVGLAQVAPADGSVCFPLFLRHAADLPPAVAQRPDFPVQRLPAHSRAVRYAFDLPRAVARFSPAADLLYTQTHAPPLGPVPNILHVADLSFRHHPEFYPLLTRLRLNLLVPFQARRARAVFTVSEFARRDIINTFAIPPDRVFVVPNAVVQQPRTVPEEPTERTAWLAQLGVRQPYIVYVGNLHPRKNLRRLLAAFAAARRSVPELEQYQLVLVGAQHNFYPRMWEPGEADRMRSGADHNHIVATGQVSDVARDRLIRAAEVLAYPSLFEGFGLPPVESMAVGTPVLASNTSALPEVLGDAALLVDPYDVEAIARGLARLIQEPGLRQSLRERGWARAARYATRSTGERALAAFICAAALKGPNVPTLSLFGTLQSRSTRGSSSFTRGLLAELARRTVNKWTGPAPR